VKAPAIKMQAVVHEVLSFGRDRQAAISVGSHQLVATEVTTAAPLEQETTLFAALSGVYAFDQSGQRLPLRGDHA